MMNRFQGNTTLNNDTSVPLGDEKSHVYTVPSKSSKIQKAEIDRTKGKKNPTMLAGNFNVSLSAD